MVRESEGFWHAICTYVNRNEREDARDEQNQWFKRIGE